MATSVCRVCGEPQPVPVGKKAPYHVAEGHTRKCVGSNQGTTVQ